MDVWCQHLLMLNCFTCFFVCSYMILPALASRSFICVRVYIDKNHIYIKTVHEHTNPSTCTYVDVYQRCWWHRGAGKSISVSISIYLYLYLYLRTRTYTCLEISSFSALETTAVTRVPTSGAGAVLLCDRGGFGWSPRSLPLHGFVGHVPETFQTVCFNVRNLS